MGWVLLENLITQLDKIWNPKIHQHVHWRRHINSNHNYISHSSVGTLNSIARGKLLTAHVVKKFHTHYDTCILITAFERVLSQHQPAFFLTSTLILSSHLWPYLPISFFLRCLPIRLWHAFLIPLYVYPFQLIIKWITVKYLTKNDYETDNRQEKLIGRTN
jgi:hypothetical protein